jgi:Fe-S-cluster containining protein
MIRRDPEATAEIPSMPTREPMSGCRRCGACCRKGGPALHREDRPLVEAGAIPLGCLFTIRRGEPVADPIAGRRILAPAEIIKIKGRDGTWSCCFWDGRRRRCRIYADRPLECRLLECWNTGPFERRYAAGRLTRGELLSGVAGLWDLVAEHERRCNIAAVMRLLAGAAAGGPEGRELARIVAYDRELRRLAVAAGGLSPETADFLFGRPLAKLLAPLRRHLAEKRAASGR